MRTYLSDIVHRIALPSFRNANGDTWHEIMGIIEEYLINLRHTVHIQEWKDEFGRTFKNFIVRIEGKSKETFILGAHYDTFEDTPGADDNASAVAVLLGVLKNISPSEPLAYSWEFVLYACEEPPFFGTKNMGSYQHAARLNPADIKCMICLEMVGYFSNEPNSQHYPFSPLKWIYGNKGNFLLGVSNRNSRKIAREIMKHLQGCNPSFYRKLILPFQLSGLDWSDHKNYWSHNIPALMITDTAMFRNSNYHASKDLPFTLNYQLMERLALDLVSLIKKG